MGWSSWCGANGRRKPPRTCYSSTVSLQGEVLETMRRRGEAPRILVRHRAWYMLVIEPEQLDLELFQRASRRRGGNACRRAPFKRRRGRLVRGRLSGGGHALADLEAPFATVESVRLEESYASARWRIGSSRTSPGQHRSYCIWWREHPLQRLCDQLKPVYDDRHVCRSDAHYGVAAFTHQRLVSLARLPK